MKSMKNNSYVDNFNCLPCTGKECCKLDTALIDKQLISMNDEETVKDFLSQSNLFWNCRNYNITLRYSMLIVQFVFISIAIALSVVVFLSRKKKIIKHSMWVLLEMILFGAILLYLTVRNLNFCADFFIITDDLRKKHDILYLIAHCAIHGA